MRNFQEKSKFRNFMQSKPVLVLLLVIVLAFAWKVIGLTGKLQETHRNKKIEEQKISDLEKRKVDRTSDILKLGTDKGKEEVIRENFGMVKEGEEVIVIIEDKNKSETIPENENKGFFSFFKNIFK